MADFYSDKDINDAINRVRQMQRRADSYIPNSRPQAPQMKQKPEPAPEKVNHQKEHTSHTPSMKNSPTKASSNPITSLISSIFSGDSDKLLIMGLILLLSKEQGDQMLIMALLYILL